MRAEDTSILGRKAEGEAVRNIISKVSEERNLRVELAMGRKPRDFPYSASTNPEQLTSTPTKQDLLNEEIQKLTVKTHLEVQQRENIRRDLSERRRFVPPDLRAGEHVFYWQEDPSKIQQGNLENG